MHTTWGSSITPTISHQSDLPRPRVIGRDGLREGCRRSRHIGRHSKTEGDGDRKSPRRVRARAEFWTLQIANEAENMLTLTSLAAPQHRLSRTTPQTGKARTGGRCGLGESETSS